MLGRKEKINECVGSRTGNYNGTEEMFVEWKELVFPTYHSEYSILDGMDGKLWWERSTWNEKRENQH